MISCRRIRISLRLLEFGFLSFGSTVAALAQDLKPKYPDEACLEIEGPMQEAVEFVEETYGTKLSGICIKSVSADVIAEAFDASAGMPDQIPEIGGLFVIAEETILIPSNLDPTRDSDLNFVVHELVHAYQFLSGMLPPDASLAPLECEAYFVQADFLRSRGLPREGLFMSLQGELQMGSACEY